MNSGVQIRDLLLRTQTKQLSPVSNCPTAGCSRDAAAGAERLELNRVTSRQTKGAHTHSHGETVRVHVRTQSLPQTLQELVD